MAIQKSRPMRFTPRGLTDAFDATDEFLGAALELANLIFDNANRELMVPRPGVNLIASLATLGFAAPTFISIQASIGSRIYGMVATTRNPGFDEPFCYDTASGTVIAISGVTGANVPASPASSGEWTPPTLTVVGVYVIITHPGFSGVGANFFGVINLTNPLVPVWSSSNTAANALTAVPKAVANQYNRAYFAVGNQLQYTDVLAPLTRTNADQALTVGDSADVNALSGLPVSTTSSGVINALTAFKKTQVWQVTGDRTLSNLALNFLSLSIGTNAPRSVAQSTAGVYFLSASGPYFIDPLGALRPLTFAADSLDPDVQAPFMNSSVPTRWAGAYASSVYRVCGPTTIRGNNVTHDYWFDEKRRRWNGPHSFAYDCASAIAGNFILTSATNPAQLLQSMPSPVSSSSYTDLGTPYNCSVVSSTFPKVGDMCEKQVTESQIELGGQLGPTYTIEAQNEVGDVLDTVTIEVPSLGTPLWGGGSVWGDGTLWTSGENVAPRTYAVPWTAPLVFEKLRLSIQVEAALGVQIGTFYALYQKTGYMTQLGGLG